MRRVDRSLILLLLAFVSLALAYSVANPLHEATDELRHYRFVRYIAVNQRLPVQGQEPCRSQSHHPPLFYLLGALATGWIDTGREICHNPPANPFWAYRYFDVGVDNKNQYLHGPDEAFPWSGEALAAHIVRAINVLFGAGTVWLTWAAGRAVWPRRRTLALAGAAIVAFNPMLLYMAGAINNDVIAAFSGTAVLLGAIRLLADPDGLTRRRAVTLGALFALALMSKFNLVALGLLIAVAVTLVAWRRRQWRAWPASGLLIGLTTAVLAGWWFVRNQLLYGEPTGFQVLTELWGVRNPFDSLGLAVSELPYAWSSLWGRFGFGQIPLPDGAYALLAWLSALALAGWGLALWRRVTAVRRDGAAWLHWPTDAAVLLLGLDVLIVFAVLFNYMLVSPAGAMGRFFFPGLPALALLIAYGLEEWLGLAVHRLRLTPERPWRRWLSGVVVLAMLAFALVALFGYLVPAYARPPAWPDGLALPNPVDAQFDSLVTLRGYMVTPEAIEPGQPLDVTLYWEVTGQPPGDYLLFVHLIDNETGGMISQRDTHPGLGNFPSSQWRPGDRFVETIRLFLPEAAYAPSTARLSVGLYARDAYRLGIRAPDGTGLGDALTLAEALPIEPWSGGPTAVPNPLDQNFGRQIRLIGYEYGRRSLPPGETLSVRLFLAAETAVTDDYRVELSLLDDQGRVVTRADAFLSPAPALWPAGQRFDVLIRLPLPEALPPGAYGLQLRLFAPGRDRPLDIVAADGHLVNDRLPLSAVRVAP